MIQSFTLHTEYKSREVFPGNFTDLSHVCNYSDINGYPNSYVPWHWHDAFEVDYIIKGTLELRTSEERVTLEQGDVVFINAGVLHAYQSLDRQDCNLVAHIFDMEFLSGEYNNILERKYILPIRESGMPFYMFSPDSPRRVNMASAVTQAVELCNEEPFGYEFDLRSKLCEFWKGLYLETEEMRGGAERRSTIDVERIKQMMEYIQENYAERLALEDIADAAGISTRECTRCFNRCLGMTPIQYVTRYRLREAADMLLHTSDSILVISEACGFSSSGYFSRTFSEYLGCTPREYRASGGVVEQKADDLV